MAVIAILQKSRAYGNTGVAPPSRTRRNLVVRPVGSIGFPNPGTMRVTFE